MPLRAVLEVYSPGQLPSVTVLESLPQAKNPRVALHGDLRNLPEEYE